MKQKHSTHYRLNRSYKPIGHEFKHWVALVALACLGIYLISTQENAPVKCQMFNTIRK